MTPERGGDCSGVPSRAISPCNSADQVRDHGSCGRATLIVTAYKRKPGIGHLKGRRNLPSPGLKLSSGQGKED